jgi:hypothetical protein
MSREIFMMHVVDAVEAINLDHTGTGIGRRVPEGMVLAGLDPVATDLVCARYMFSNVSLHEALKLNLDDGTGESFPQRVPLAAVKGNNIVTQRGYDCPLSRDICFEQAETRGLGTRRYYVVGHDSITGASIISVHGHLGTVEEGAFSDLLTSDLYFDVYKFPWDMQRTAFSYMEAVDKLEGSTTKRKFLEAVDEDGDGIVTYEEFGKKGTWGSLIYLRGLSVSKMGSERLGYLKAVFDRVAVLKYADPLMNLEGHDVYKEVLLGGIVLTAYQMSRSDMERPDPFVPGLKWGKGKWPSMPLARFIHIGMSLYGRAFPKKVAFPSPYASAWLYAELTQSGDRNTGRPGTQTYTKAVNRYVTGTQQGDVTPLDFTFYVPEGFDGPAGNKVPNVEVTDDRARILTVRFAGGKEVWPELTYGRSGKMGAKKD